MPRKIGILFGKERSFPPVLAAEINRIGEGRVTAEPVSLGPLRQDVPSGYDVILDRISHEVPFYRTYLKVSAALGAQVVNNPYWWSSDDKFLNNTIALAAGVAVPKTMLLPHKMHPPGTNERSMRNLRYPIVWDDVFKYVGFPAFLKPFDGGGWKDVYKIGSPSEFFSAYDGTRDLCMTLQRGVNFREYFRCYVVGQENVRIMPYDPRVPFHERYVRNPPAYDPALIARVERDAITLCRALGYDLNTVEFAVEDGVPYAIDFMNPAPDADVRSVGPDNFEWIVAAVADLAVRKALEPPGQGAHRWDALLQ